MNGYFKIKVPNGITVELLEIIDNSTIDNINFTKLTKVDDSEIEVKNLNFSLGGDEINILKIFFETGLAFAIEEAGKFILDQIISLIKKSATTATTNNNSLANEIMVTYPDGSIYKIKTAKDIVKIIKPDGSETAINLSNN
jgi:hypothetical protein